MWYDLSFFFLSGAIFTPRGLRCSKAGTMTSFQCLLICLFVIFLSSGVRLFGRLPLESDTVLFLSDAEIGFNLLHHKLRIPRLDSDTKRFINHLSLGDTWDTFGLIAQVVGKIVSNVVRIQVLDQDALIAVIGAMNRLPMLRRFPDLNCARKFNFRIQAFQNTYHIPRALIYPPQKGITASK